MYVPQLPSVLAAAVVVCTMKLALVLLTTLVLSSPPPLPLCATCKGVPWFSRPALGLTWSNDAAVTDLVASPDDFPGVHTETCRPGPLSGPSGPVSSRHAACCPPFFGVRIHFLVGDVREGDALLDTNVA